MGKHLRLLLAAPLTSIYEGLSWTIRTGWLENMKKKCWGFCWTLPEDDYVYMFEGSRRIRWALVTNPTFVKFVFKTDSIDCQCRTCQRSFSVVLSGFNVDMCFDQTLNWCNANDALNPRPCESDAQVSFAHERNTCNDFTPLVSMQKRAPSEGSLECMCECWWCNSGRIPSFLDRGLNVFAQVILSVCFNAILLMFPLIYFLCESW